MLVDIPRGEGANKRKPGTWMLLLAHTAEPEYHPYWSAVIFCPDCKRPLSAVNHSIAENGQITPSLGHPDAYSPCGWHTSPRLIGWEPRAWVLPSIPSPETCAGCGKVAHIIGGWGTYNGPGLLCGDCLAGIAETAPAADGAKS